MRAPWLPIAIGAAMWAALFFAIYYELMRP